jgi:hypothetical protein
MTWDSHHKAWFAGQFCCHQGLMEGEGVWESFLVKSGISLWEKNAGQWLGSWSLSSVLQSMTQGCTYSSQPLLHLSFSLFIPAIPQLRCKLLNAWARAIARVCELVSQPGFPPASVHPVSCARVFIPNTGFGMISFACSGAFSEPTLLLGLSPNP